MNYVEFVAAARSEYLAEVAYYSEIEAGLGLRFARAVEQAASRALVFPAAGSPFGAGTRRVFVKGFPFALVYMAKPSGILIFAIAPHAKSPGYWRSRVVSR